MGIDTLHADMFLPLCCTRDDEPVDNHAAVVIPPAAPATPGERSETAAARFHTMGCAQALATTYADMVGLSAQEAANLTAGFNHGMGRHLTCGAVTAMLMLAGLANKGNMCNELIEEFETQTGSSSCDYFLEKHQGHSHCPHLLHQAASLLNHHIFTNPQTTGEGVGSA